MKRILHLVLAGSCFLLMGCPLQTESPITGDAPASIPSWLPGKWTKIKEGSASGTTYQVKTDPANRAKLVIITMDDSGKPNGDEPRPSVVSTVKGRLFLSVYDKGDDASDQGYYHYAIARDADGDLQLIPLKEHIVSSAAGGDELRSYIVQHAGSDDYLDRTGTERYRKQK